MAFCRGSFGSVVWSGAMALSWFASMAAAGGSRSDVVVDSHSSSAIDSTIIAAVEKYYDDVHDNDQVISVVFYGESQCPYCRKFVQEAWPTVWNDSELMEYVDYDFVAWGNAYFVTHKCSTGTTYDPQERACWYQECIETSSDNDDECFSGKVIYQHSLKEGQVDIYEMCVKLHYGIEAAVDFTYCCEGPNMDDPSLEKAHDLLLECTKATSIDPNVIQDCFATHGHAMEIKAAKATPTHPGVPYVLVDGVALEDPFSIQKTICDKLKQKKQQRSSTTAMLAEEEGFDLPKSCETLDPNEVLNAPAKLVQLSV